VYCSIFFYVPGNTRECTGTHGNTQEHTGIHRSIQEHTRMHRNTLEYGILCIPVYPCVFPCSARSRVFPCISGNTRIHTGIHRHSREYSGMHGNEPECREIRPWCTPVYSCVLVCILVYSYMFIPVCSCRGYTGIRESARVYIKWERTGIHGDTRAHGHKRNDYSLDSRLFLCSPVC
jgi:hypothetical protein